MNGQYLIPANTKRGQLIFSIFRPIDLYIAIGGGVTTVLLFFIIDPDSTLSVAITLLPLLVCAFLVIPIPNYHNIMCVLGNIYRFYFKEKQEFIWKGWCAKNEFKE
ncbi:MAG TPA: hypothetical protein IAB68_00290 [Candidatus Aphodocola excrementigallinarum]|uniref:Uncharacterized protein n=1 Tax=Candidatus Aphodocola excrementigallinarum TaxID=2840670 RepID=A0A9D1ILV0_9FIRM|nr:hypothetical protein [Candidatus Aphodocola excrementigallinarum]